MHNLIDSDYANRVAGLLFRERLQRELARRVMIRFCDYVRPDWISAAHHLLIGEKLDAIMSGDLSRLMVSMPPRHGKSLMCSVLFPALWLAHNPDKQIIHISYSSSLSNEFSRQVRALLRGDPFYRALFPHVQLDPDRQRLDDWKLSAGGGFKSVGVQGGVTGHGADLMIIDDPVKEGDEQSPATLQAIYDWYLSAARTRLAPGASVLIIMTRWHPLDLVGRLLDLARKDDNADQWEELVLPALAGEDDPLGRQPGQALWADRFDENALHAIRSLSERYFDALFQQDPKIGDSQMFREEDFIRAPVDFDQGVWTFDLAATDNERSDYSVFARWRLVDDTLYLGEIVRFRAEWPETKARLLAVIDRHPDDVYVFPKQVHELLALQEVRRLRPDVSCSPCSMPRDKVSRALVFSDHVAAGNVVVCEGEAGDYFVWEHANFPDAAQHDDCVDCSSVVTHYFGLGRLFDVKMSAIDYANRGDPVAEILERMR